MSDTWSLAKAVRKVEFKLLHMGQEPRLQEIVREQTTATFGLSDLLLYFLHLGTLGFGGPIALAGHMQKDPVDERHWFSEQDYLEGLAFSQLSPGPLAAPLAMYLGWLRDRTLGATTVGIAFILPSFLALELSSGQDLFFIYIAGQRFASLVAATRPNTTKIDLPSSSHTPGVREVNMKWITRKDIKVDRVACPWLIKRFVDPQAEFLFVEEKDLLEQSKQHDAIPFDAPKIEAIKLNHRGSRCSFEAILEDYAVLDPALQKLALIVRAADVKGQESAAPEGIGLRSIAQGFAALGISDEERLLRQFPIYDALYAYVQSR